VQESAEGIYIAPNLNAAVDSDIIIEKKVLPEQSSNISTEILMAAVSSKILEAASNNISDVKFKKYNISGMDAYVITGTLNVGGQTINENYYFIRKGTEVYTITAEAKSTSATSVLSTIIDSINTLKITK
jgi:hypothetical protein